MVKQNWFNTLNEALESEGLVDYWPFGLNLGYGETARVVKDGKFITVYRENDGRYERPIHYDTQMVDSYKTCKVGVA